MNEYVKEHIFDRRNIEKVLTRDQIKGIQIISGPKIPDEDQFDMYGSFLYRAQPYPSDIDGTQSYTFCKKKGCTRDKVELETAKILKDTVTKILNTKDAYLGDIKIGVDTEIENVIYIIQKQYYKDSIDKQWEKYLKKSKRKDKKRASHTYLDEDQVPQLLIHGYQVNFPQKKVLKLWKDRFNKGIISKESFEKLKKLIPNKIKGKDGIDKFFTYCEVVRNLYILRWTGDEVLQGFKMIGNREITLVNAIKNAIFYSCKENEKKKSDECINKTTKKVRSADKSGHIIKIDMFAVTGGKIMEFSNLFTVYFKNSKRKNKKEFLAFGRGGEGDVSLLIEHLLSDMTLYYIEATKKYKKPMKYAKRMFVISRLRRDKKIGLKFYELFRSDTNLLNSINSQIDVVIAILSDQPNPPMDILYNQLEEQKFRMSQIIELDLDQDAFYDIINKIISGKMSKKDIISTLLEIKKHYSEIISENVKEYLKKKKLWPGPYFSKNNFEFIYG